ncbi:hypothetical protein [Marinobacter sp. ATCH36]|uniref:hypothetical protein n=1 Tax=Marinobacter sp. ATCH36 TaxID=2945106 RepID=UPI0020206FFB|nr:hypothetical protein [Marinobacter sp. ATCH36]MCL7944051.1 hypothetical protein [Marinobacter sp. ATCH36]
MVSKVDQVEMTFLTDLPKGTGLDVKEFLRAQMRNGRDVWCRIPDHLQAFVRRVSYGIGGEVQRTEHFPLSSDHRYLSVPDQVIREILAVGRSEVSKTELVASIDESLELIKSDLGRAALERWRKDLSEKQTFIKSLQSSSTRRMSDQEVFVVGISTKNDEDGIVSGKVKERSFSIKLSDLFVLGTHYQKSLSEAQANDAVPFMDEWMPEDLRLLNRYAADYNKKYPEPGQASMDNDALKKLRKDLTSDLKARDSNGPKITAAIKIILGKREYNPKAPIKAIPGEAKVSLLDIANALARSYWKGTVDETQRTYKADVDRFNQNIEQLLGSHGVIKPAALSRELSRFIRFTR